MAAVYRKKYVIGEAIDAEFFDAIAKRWPDGFKVFADWFSKYQAANNWVVLFNSRFRVVEQVGRIHEAPRFSDLPYALQFGIWFEFRLEKDGFGTQELDIWSFLLQQDVAEWIEQKNLEIIFLED